MHVAPNGNCILTTAIVNQTIRIDRMARRGICRGNAYPLTEKKYEKKMVPGPVARRGVGRLFGGTKLINMDMCATVLRLRRAEPETQTESRPHRAIPVSPLLRTKYEIRGP